VTSIAFVLFDQKFSTAIFV